MRNVEELWNFDSLSSTTDDTPEGPTPRVAIVEDGEDVDWLWMSKRDIAKNMMAFGRHPELVKAHEAYGA